MNLNGDYLSDALAAQIGGIGIAPGANINYVTGHAIFEATHGTAPKYANLDQVNPGSVILSGEMMLRYMGWTEAADLIIKGMDGAISAKTVTYDFERLMKAEGDTTSRRSSARSSNSSSRTTPPTSCSANCTSFGRASPSAPAAPHSHPSSPHATPASPDRGPHLAYPPTPPPAGFFLWLLSCPLCLPLRHSVTGSLRHFFCYSLPMPTRSRTRPVEVHMPAADPPQPPSPGSPPRPSAALRVENASPSYTSSLPYESARIHAAAIYCSDGRLGEHFDDLLQQGLGLPRYDRVTLPGGPACLAGHPQATLEEKGVIDELQFLVEVHRLKRVVLIAHQGCAFYSTRIGLKEPRLELVQRADLVRAAAYVHQVTSLDNIEAYFARHVEGKVQFERVEV
jgi:hypothetical protein